jgi:hypothetical protein
LICTMMAENAFSHSSRPKMTLSRRINAYISTPSKTDGTLAMRDDAFCWNFHPQGHFSTVTAP